MGQRAWALTLVGLLGAGCGGDDFSSSGGTGGSGGSTTGGSGGVATGGSGGAAAGSGGVATGGSGGTCTSYDTTLAADTTIFPEGSLAAPNCGGTNTLGAAPILSAGGIGGPSKTLLRFNLPPGVITAWNKGQLQAVTLTLTRDTAGGHDCGRGQCPKGTGVLHASALRNDWVQGAGSSSGANWCWLDRATTATSWAANGASAIGADRSATAATATVEPTMTKVTFSLGPDFLKPWVVNNQLSLIVERGDAGAPNFYHTSKEHMAAVPATLAFTACE